MPGRDLVFFSGCRNTGCLLIFLNPVQRKEKARVFPGPADTFRNIRDVEGNTRVLLQHHVVDLAADILESGDRFDVPVGFFHIGVEERDDAPVKDLKGMGACLPLPHGGLIFYREKDLFHTG
jgi:hypothetical protein